MTGIRLSPYPSKYIVNEEGAGADKYWSKSFTYDDLLFAYGQHVKDYADISHLATGLMYSKLGITESTALSPFYEFTTGSGGVQDIDKNWVRWRIYGDPERRAMSVGNFNAHDYLGTNKSPFRLRLDVAWFKWHDVLTYIGNKRVQVMVVSEEAEPVEGHYEYDVVLIDEDDAAFIPVEYLAAGEYWIKIGSVTSWEKAGTPGSIQWGFNFSYLEFEVPLNTGFWEFEIEGEAHRQWGKMAITRCDQADQPMPEASKVFNFVEMKANEQITFEKELTMCYGSKSEHLIDRNTKEQITTGPGLFEFLEEGNIIPYSPDVHHLDFIMDQIEAYWFDRVPIPQRELVLYTGQGGLKLFHDWVSRKYNEVAVTATYDFVLHKRTPFDPRGGRQGYAFGAPQFVEYMSPTFGSIKVALWPILDNTRINGITMPGDYKPISSYEFIAINTAFGEPAIKFFSRSDNKIETYIPGLWSPFGATGQNNPVFKTPAYSKESYKWIHKETYGLVLMDPSATLWFKPNVAF